MVHEMRRCRACAVSALPVGPDDWFSLLDIAEFARRALAAEREELEPVRVASPLVGGVLVFARLAAALSAGDITGSSHLTRLVATMRAA
jgi:hypothetical protein